MMRSPQTVNTICKEAEAGQRCAVAELVTLLWLMMGNVATLEAELAFHTQAPLTRDANHDCIWRLAEEEMSSDARRAAD